MRRSLRFAVAPAAILVVGTLAAVPAGAVTGAAPSRAASWAPQPASYGEGSELNQPVTMSDGTVLRADVYYPTAAATRTAAAGPFPVLLQQTPYGKQNVSGSVGALANTNVAYFVDRGYIVVIADVRGTGSSGGSWSLFTPVQGTDGAALVDWSTRLPHADGRVGLFGESYMGINQFLTVADLPRDNPVKAMFPIIAGNDLYQDTVTQGGLIDAEFSAFYLGLVGGLNGANPVATPLQRAGNGTTAAISTAATADTLTEELEHDAGLLSYDAPSLVTIETGGPESYDGPYWAARSPLATLADVVADRIPAFLVGGWHDLFQRGELLNYTGLQNLVAKRPVLGPMSAGQSASPRYQLLMGPWTHLTTGNGVDLTRTELEWFDSWLLGQKTPLQTTTTPLHLNLLGTNTWVNAATWPLTSARATQLFFGAGPSSSTSASDNQGTLTSSPPGAPTGSDPVVFTGASSACDLQTDQWSAGLIAVASADSGVTDPCTTDDVTLGAGPGALTYTSAPASSAEVIGGPIDVSIYATSTTTDTELVATAEEVGPTGTSVPLTSGALLGEFRPATVAHTWTGSDGEPILPAHAETAGSAKPVVPGALTRYDIQVFPTFAEVPAGWSIRVTITTSGTPQLAPTLAQMPSLAGGVYQVERHAGAASFVNLPLAPVRVFSTPCTAVCSPAT